MIPDSTLPVRIRGNRTLPEPGLPTDPFPLPPAASKNLAGLNAGNGRKPVGRAIGNEVASAVVQDRPIVRSCSAPPSLWASPSRCASLATDDRRDGILFLVRSGWRETTTALSIIASSENSKPGSLPALYIRRPCPLSNSPSRALAPPPARNFASPPCPCSRTGSQARTPHGVARPPSCAILQPSIDTIAMGGKSTGRRRRTTCAAQTRAKWCMIEPRAPRSCRACHVEG